jgi:hypothetical protein
VSDLVNVGSVSTAGDHVVVSLTPAGERGAEIAFQMQDVEELPFLTR